jgi:hypothetical protein
MAVYLEWDKIAEETIAVMDKQREHHFLNTQRDRLEARFKDCRDAIQEYIEARPFNHIGPGDADMALFPPVRDLLCAVGMESFGPGSKVTKKKFSDVLKGAGTWEKAWVSQREQELVEMLQQHGNSKATVTVKDLPLVSTLFKCDQCYGHISYPRILVHGCLRQYQSDLGGTLGPILHNYFTRTRPLKIAGTQWLSAVPLTETRKEIFKLCGVSEKALWKTTWVEFWKQGGAMEETVFMITPNSMFGGKRWGSLAYLVCGILLWYC